ncbi:MAG: hypothetical protein LH465_04735 [Sphingomonas bacterium]|nr:hypothetical protein [Sphingomonas bacterium]
MRYQRAEHALKLASLAAAKEFFAGCFADSDLTRESLWVAHLDDQARCLHLSRHQGDEGGAKFPFRQIIGDAAKHGSSGIVLAHNHPSGDSRPSDSDCRATRRLVSAAEALNCRVIDHLIISGEQICSFRQIGLL